MVPRAVIFDLDGTLLDTLADIRHAMNRVLVRHELPQFDREHYRRSVGDGVRKLVERSLPPEFASGERLDELTDEMKTEYRNHATEATTAYAGVTELLDALRERGIPVGVLSNKLDSITQEVVRVLLGTEYFAHIQGAHPEIPKKPDPTAARTVADAMGVPPEQCVFVGDSSMDIEAAVAAEMTPVGVSWGYRAPEELRGAGAVTILDHPLELLQMLEPVEAGMKEGEQQ
jgi:phosphoglycolate phosphatase